MVETIRIMNKSIIRLSKYWEGCIDVDNNICFFCPLCNKLTRYSHVHFENGLIYEHRSSTSLDGLEFIFNIDCPKCGGSYKLLSPDYPAPMERILGS